MRKNRREFLSDVGNGMLFATVGYATAADLGFSLLRAEETDEKISFGKLEPLVTLMQETPPDKLLPVLVEKMKSGTDLKTLVSSAALSNVRAFAGQDYIGYHTFMALMPAYYMASELPEKQKASPILKVIYRNSQRIQDSGSGHSDAMHQVKAAESIDRSRAGEILRDSIRQVNWEKAESQFAALSKNPNRETFNQLQYSIQDEVNVHRVVLSWRAWDMLNLAGKEYAHSLLRQSVRFCLDTEQNIRDRKGQKSEIRNLLPKLIDEHKLFAKSLGDQKGDDAWVKQMSETIYSSSRDQAAEAVAIALAEGISPESIGEAISIAANKLVLLDPGRLEKYSSPQKPAGCVHGDSIGVHASDAANAWRNIARVCNQRNQVASLIVGAYHTAGQSNWVKTNPFSYSQYLDEFRSSKPEELLVQAEEAIQANDQARACAITQVYGEMKLPYRPMFDLMLKYALSQDGALHAEKYYRTVIEEHSTVRPAFRWNHVIALARVTASEYGYPAPGYQEINELLKTI